MLNKKLLYHLIIRIQEFYKNTCIYNEIGHLTEPLLPAISLNFLEYRPFWGAFLVVLRVLLFLADFRVSSCSVLNL